MFNYRTYLKIWHQLTALEKGAVVLWAIVLISSLIRLGLSPEKHSVYPNFSIAAQRWVQSNDLYASQRNYDYRYSPIVAIAFTPLLPLGNRFGGMFWCVFCTILLAVALSRWLKNGAPRHVTGNERGMIFLLMLPLSIGNLASNQANAPVLAMLLIAMSAIQTASFTLACLAITIAFFFKIYPLSLGLILLLLYPRPMSLRLFLLVTIGLIIPFAFQRPSFVSVTYQNWIHYLTVEDRSILGPGRAYRDFQFLLHDLSIVVSQHTYRLIELFVAGVFGLFVLLARFNRWPAPRLHFFAFTLAICWMTVFGPATESMTYLLIAPVVCWYLMEKRHHLSSRSGWIYALSYLLLLYPPAVGLFPNHSILRSPHLKSIQPVAVLMILAATLTDALNYIKTPPNPSLDQSVPPFDSSANLHRSKPSPA